MRRSGVFERLFGPEKAYLEYRIVVFFIFLGSVFITSRIFVEEVTAAKYYLTTLTILMGSILVIFRSDNLRDESKKLASLPVLKGVFIVGVLQAIYGLFQYSGLFDSNHESFRLTGSFDNPAGLIAVISLIFPVGLYWCVQSQGLERRLVFFFAVVVWFCIVLSGSRAGILSAIISIILFCDLKYGLFSKIRKLGYSIPIFILVLLLTLTSLFALYKWKENSVNGRLLIWKISWEIVKDKPLFGYGYRGFQANYMDYQAQYFKLHPQSKWGQLADNIKHPFNEYIKVTVNYGVIGLLCCLFLLGVFLWKISQIRSSIRVMLLAVFASFLVVSNFSYPLQYAPVWLLLMYFGLIVFSDFIPPVQPSFAMRAGIAGICVLGMIFFFSELLYEMRWKTIATKALQGQTLQMLPQYRYLYPFLKHNPFFLYNYGAELNISKQYVESIVILKECKKYVSDYDLQMLFADSYFRAGDTVKAIQHYEYASNMIPCRFLPLYRQFEIHKGAGNIEKAIKVAQEIVKKEIKVESVTVGVIIRDARDFLAELSKK